MLTYKEKADELIKNLGILYAIYLAKEVLIVIEDLNVPNEIKDWKDVLEELEWREKL